MKIAVIGAGVIGLATATELAARGADVVVLEAASVGSGTSSTSYAWINGNGKEPEPYFDINRAGLEEMHRQGNGTEWFSASGHIEWASDAHHATELRRRVERLKSRSYEAEWVTPAQAKELSPGLRIPADASTIAYFPREGYVHPALLLAELHRRATTAGIPIHTGCEVTDIVTGTTLSSVKTSDGRQFEADAVVSCVGRWTDRVTALMGSAVPMVSTSDVGGAGVGFLAVTNPVPVDHHRLLSSSELNVRPAGGGRFMLQSTLLDADADAGKEFAVDSPVAMELLNRFRRLFVNADHARIESFVVGQRAMPADGLSVIGRITPDSPHYVVATHSGMTMSLALGGWVADEVLGQTVPLLEAFRPARLLDGTATFKAPVPRLPGQQ